MGFLLLAESRVTHDTDGKKCDPVMMFANSQAFGGMCQTNYTVHCGNFSSGWTVAPKCLTCHL